MHVEIKQIAGSFVIVTDLTAADVRFSEYFEALREAEQIVRRERLRYERDNSNRKYGR